MKTANCSQLEPPMMESRGQRLWKLLRERRDTEPLSLARAKLVTEAYRETEGLPHILRRARAFEKIVTEIPIYIDEEQLLVGDFASKPMAAEWFPEFTVEWVLNEVNDGRSPYMISETEVSIMREICDYWKDKAARETFYHYLGEEEVERLNKLNEQGSWVFAASMEAQGEKGWNIPNYPKAINMGLSGILKEIEKERSETRILDGASFYKTCFLDALSIVIKAAVLYTHRYAALARDLSMQHKGDRKKELEKIAAICEWIPENPARSFYEAVQTMWFCHVLTFWDSRTVGVSFGRVDQFLYPYYERDIKKGVMKKNEAVEILECFRIKMSAQRNFNNSYMREATAGETQFHNCTLGGQKSDGSDATNELSYLWLEAAERIRTPHPTLSVRWHDRISPDFAMKAAELCRLGMGYPAWFGDKTSIEYLMMNGSTLEEAREYGIAGCVLHVIPHKTAITWPTVMSIAKVLEITLHNGIDPGRDIQIGLPIGSLKDFQTYEDLYEAFKKQLKYFLGLSTNYLNKVRIFRAEKLPDLFLSSLFDDCIKRGDSVGGGGAHYQHSSMYLIPVGVVDSCDSLAAIKKSVFEEKLISKGELLEALKVNFKGKENIRDILLSAPKFGNDDDFVDNIIADFYSWLSTMLSEIEGPYGSKYVNAPHSLSFHGAAGRKVGALPSGRLSGLSLADGAVSPAQGADRRGPTAVIKSAGKIDHLPIFGTLFNMKFNPSILKTREDLTKLLALIRTYFDNYGGKHIQFNTIDKKTLLDAQAKPENYKNLVIRVAGYSAFWVELDKKIQDEVIRRTEHAM